MIFVTVPKIMFIIEILNNTKKHFACYSFKILRFFTVFMFHFVLLWQKSMEEKLEAALQSKAFFKEKWARAVREINCIKNEHERAIQIQIKHNEEELRNLG